MKKSRLFLAIATIALAISGFAAGKTAKKYSLPATLYYFTGSSYFSFRPGCLSIFLTISNPGSYGVAVIQGASNVVCPIYRYFSLLSIYVPVYNNSF